MKISNLDILLDCKIWNVEKLIKTHEQPERIHERVERWFTCLSESTKMCIEDEQKNEQQNIYTMQCGSGSV